MEISDTVFMLNQECKAQKISYCSLALIGMKPTAYKITIIKNVILH